ncbi:MAG: GtrA family protein [Desulfovibrio sp.]|jgi:putative flippase GtrA|nr:GtrA family protein [Desulfovibrio sp.]
MSATQPRRFLLFCCSGALAFCVDYAILRGLVFLGMAHWVARVVSFAAAATTTWQFNSRVTFARAQARLSGLAGWLGYMSTALAGGIVNYIAYLCVLHFLGAVDAATMFFGVACGSCAGLAVNYILCSAWFFTRPHGK